MADRERSPNYPAAGLTDAVEMIKRFYAAEGRTPVDPLTASKAIGYSGLSGPSRVKLAAMKKYGLLQGRGDNLSISPLGLRIVHPDDDADYADALREAALTPDLFRALAQTHLGASENAIIAHLIKARDFTQDGARQFAKSFKDTIAIAKLTDGTYNPEDSSTVKGATEEKMGTEINPRVNTLSPPPPPGGFQRTFKTGNEHMDAVINISTQGGEVTKEDIEFLKDYLTFLEKGWSRKRNASGGGQNEEL